MENKEKRKKDSWIRLASKSRPGRFYMFNKDTAETQWLPFKQQEGESEQAKLESPPKISITKSSKTPAQDRLKRLQHDLKISQTRSQSTRFTRHLSDLEAVKKQQEQENRLKEQPSTSSSAKETFKSLKKSTKRHSSNCVSYEVENSDKDFTPPSVDEAKKLRLSKSSNNTSCATSKKSVSVEIATEAESESLKSIVLNNVEHLQNMEENNNCSLNSLRTGIMKKIKEICKMPFSMSKKIAEEKSSAKEEKSSSLINAIKFKPKRKTKDNKHREAISQLKEENRKTPNLKVPTNNSEISTPKNAYIPSYPRGSANSRLESLKQSLLSQQHVQQKSSTTTSNSESSKETLNLSFKTNNSYTTLIKVEDIHKDTINSLYHTANNTTNNEVEAMDWQPIVKDEEPIKMSSTRSTLVIEKSKKLVFDKDVANTNETMGDIYDRVNENLLRFSAEKQNDSSDNTKQWRRDFYYFIVDTNVLLRDLTFVEDLTKMKLCNTKGSMLFIPYSVLQELDKLKMRSGCQEGVKTRAVRVIKYLNSKFENNSPHLKAQSALDERQRLVDISSADDSIINCCLQAKEHVPNLLLLTEDVNLRNKAICNNILVSTKSDLVSKRYDASDTKDNS